MEEKLLKEIISKLDTLIELYKIDMSIKYKIEERINKINDKKIQTNKDIQKNKILQKLVDRTI